MLQPLSVLYLLHIANINTGSLLKKKKTIHRFVDVVLDESDELALALRLCVLRLVGAVEELPLRATQSSEQTD